MRPHTAAGSSALVLYLFSMLTIHLLQSSQALSIDYPHHNSHHHRRQTSDLDTPQGDKDDALDADQLADPCALASATSLANSGMVSMELVQKCYELIEFDPEVRDAAVDSVLANLQSFYIFFDIAKNPPPMADSDLQSVDLTKMLLDLKNQSFTSDYDFHNTLSNTLGQLQDPHTVYKNLCYRQFEFVQPISTYGVYENGQQRVRVASVLDQFDPSIPRDVLDCEVIRIDGEPAFEAMTKFARSKSFSKDRGVRLNKMFANLAHDKSGSSMDLYTLGAFAQRSVIPASPSVQYDIQCDGPYTGPDQQEKQIIRTFHLNWTAVDVSMQPYSDQDTFRAAFCEQDSFKQVKTLQLDRTVADQFDSDLVGPGQKASELYRGPYASFHLLSDGSTGVFRLGTEESSKTDLQHDLFYANIDTGFEMMREVGVKKLIIDLQNNSGGIICWGRYVLQTLFPSTGDAPYEYNLRASPLAQALTRATFQYNVNEYSSPYEGLMNPSTGDAMTGLKWMIPGTFLVDREGMYSENIADRFCDAVATLKDSNITQQFNAKDMVILTNGFCGSTCAVLALQLKERYGVQTLSVGGLHNAPMNFASFPGGAVQANNTLWVEYVHDLFSTLPVEEQTSTLTALLPGPLPMNGQLAFTFRQVMSFLRPNKAYEYLRIPSDFRLDYTRARFRRPSVLWEDVKRAVWSAGRRKV